MTEKTALTMLDEAIRLAIVRAAADIGKDMT